MLFFRETKEMQKYRDVKRTRNKDEILLKKIRIMYWLLCIPGSLPINIVINWLVP